MRGRVLLVSCVVVQVCELPVGDGDDGRPALPHAADRHGPRHPHGRGEARQAGGGGCWRRRADSLCHGHDGVLSSR